MADAVLGFDTATQDVAVAVTVDGEVLSERRVAPEPEGRPRAATALLVEVEAAVAAAGGWDRIGIVAVGVGPGSFTGLRIGVATARALAQAQRRPLAAVGTLAALARGIGESPSARDQPRLAVVDARRGEVFAALFDPDGKELWPPFVAAPESLAERIAALGSTPVTAGDGSVRFRHQLETAGANVLPDGDEAHRIRARHLCVLAAEAEARRPEAVEPVYLRRPDAELWREQQHGDDG